MRFRKRAALILSALLINPLAATALHARECFGGVSCLDAALASNSFKLARDCPSVFKLDPSKLGRFQKVMYAVRHRPMAGVWGDEYTNTAQLRPIDECMRAANEVAKGKIPGTYLVVRPEAAVHLER